MVFPPGARVALETGPRDVVIDQQVWVLAGCIEVTLGEDVFRLEHGDCLAMRLDRPIGFSNPTRTRARYLVALSTGDPARIAA